MMEENKVEGLSPNDNSVLASITGYPYDCMGMSISGAQTRL